MHNVPVPKSDRDKSTVTRCYGIGEMESWTTHFLKGFRNATKPCLNPDNDPDGHCALCVAGEDRRVNGYFPALLIASNGEGRVLVPVAVGVPDLSRQGFPKKLTGALLNVFRVRGTMLAAEVIERVKLPLGITMLFDLKEALDYHFSKNDPVPDPEITVPEIPAEAWAQAVAAIEDMERRAREERGRGNAQQPSERVGGGVNFAALGDDELRRMAADKVFRVRAEAAAEELRTRKVDPPPKPVPISPPPAEEPRKPTAAEFLPLKLHEVMADVEAGKAPNRVAGHFEKANTPTGYAYRPHDTIETLDAFTDRQIAESNALIREERVA